ncbi:MAG: aconitate hydratase AcnA [Pseudomonadota bacterium]
MANTDLATLKVGNKTYAYAPLPEGLSNVPVSLKILIENLLRFGDDDQAAVMARWPNGEPQQEFGFRPARVLMQDFTGVPAVVDLAAMRDAIKAYGGDPQTINPSCPVDLVIDHSVMVDQAGTPAAAAFNVDMEFKRNKERYSFLKWSQSAFSGMRIVPPGTGICHQVNIEYLAKTVWVNEDADIPVAYPDTLVGLDSHTTMVNALGVLGWGVGGIEAEAAMLGQPIAMSLPEVVGVELIGKLPPGALGTDLVLTLTHQLRAKGVVGKFVEFYGDGLDHLTLADRATIANMAPEYGATCGFFPVDEVTCDYLRLTGRDADQIALVKAYCQAQGLWRDPAAKIAYTDTMHLDLATIEPSLAGPSRPQDLLTLKGVPKSFAELGTPAPAYDPTPRKTINHGDIVIAAITSCTNTSNPTVMVAAGLLARAARKRGLTARPWVKTSLAPGSHVVSDYLDRSGLQEDLDALGFAVVGFGCTTCIGNSGPLEESLSETIATEDLNVSAVLSGNRNFQGRIHPQVKANYLASPPLVVAYALAGSVSCDLTKDPLGMNAQGKPVMLADLWPSFEEIQAVINDHVTEDAFRRRYADVMKGPPQWQELDVQASTTYPWQDSSTYVRLPPYFEGMPAQPAPLNDVIGARLLAVLGDSVTTDHISPAGNIKQDGPAGDYLSKRNVTPALFNSYGSRRGNHEVMMRGTFANIRLRNALAGDIEGGVTICEGEIMPIYDAAMTYKAQGTPLIVIAGDAYGTGSSRDWAAKGTQLLGVRLVIAQSFERIHRSNLIGMGVLPLEFDEGWDRARLNLTGEEIFDLRDLQETLQPRGKLSIQMTQDGQKIDIPLRCRIDTREEMEYLRHGGILPFVLRKTMA